MHWVRLPLAKDMTRFSGQGYRIGILARKAKAIDREIKETVDRCYQRAHEVLGSHRRQLEMIAQALLEKETLNADEISALMEGQTLDTPEAKKLPAGEQVTAEGAEVTKKTRVRGKESLPGKSIDVGVSFCSGEECNPPEEGQ